MKRLQSFYGEKNVAANNKTRALWKALAGFICRLVITMPLTAGK